MEKDVAQLLLDLIQTEAYVIAIVYGLASIAIVLSGLAFLRTFTLNKRLKALEERLARKDVV